MEDHLFSPHVKNDFLKCVEIQHNDGKRVKERASLYTPFSTGNLSRDIFSHFGCGF